MNTHKTFSLLAAVLIVAGQAALFAADTHASVPDANSDTYPAHAVSLTASTLRADLAQGA
ncbi:MAG: hypothetical protein JSR15_04995 [Proteobacteria bacterium]|nr:hypothetical protein [Pseudomonadota bacterium]